MVNGPGTVILTVRSVLARRKRAARTSTGCRRRMVPTTRGTGISRPLRLIVVPGFSRSMPSSARGRDGAGSLAVAAVLHVALRAGLAAAGIGGARRRRRGGRRGFGDLERALRAELAGPTVTDRCHAPAPGQHAKKSAERRRR